MSSHPPSRPPVATVTQRAASNSSDSGLVYRQLSCHDQRDMQFGDVVESHYTWRLPDNIGGDRKIF